MAQGASDWADAALAAIDTICEGVDLGGLDALVAHEIRYEAYLRYASRYQDDPPLQFEDWSDRFAP